MKNKFLHMTACFFCVIFLIPIPVSLANDDYIEARRLYNSGEILPLEEILKQIRQTHPGKIIEIELEREYGKIIYEVEILSKEGIVTQVYVDAISGQLLFAKEDD